VTKLSKPLIQCRACAGTGMVELSQELFDVYAMLKLLGEATAAVIHFRLRASRSTTGRVGHTAINNRLEDLRALGFAKRWKEGRQMVYEAAPITTLHRATAPSEPPGTTTRGDRT
jgi:hypothetical protein